MSTLLRRWFAPAGIALATLPERWGSATVAVVALAVVAGVLLGVLALAAGVSGLLARSGAVDVAVVFSRGAFAESDSTLSNADIAALAQAPSLRDVSGPSIGAEYVATVELLRRDGNLPSNVVARGLTTAANTLHSNASVIAGRMFGTGIDEVIVGRNLSRAFRDVDVGATLTIGNRAFRVVGLLASDGDIHESEIWGDAEQLRSAFGAPDRLSVAYARLRDGHAYDQFAAYVEALPAGLAVRRESDYYAAQGERYRQLILWPGTLIVLVMALAGLFSAINTMQTSVSERLTEIGTLRALGFGKSHIVFSILVEAGVLGVTGAGLGALLGGICMHDVQIAGSNGLSFVPFSLTVNATSIATSFLFTTLIAVVSGVLPAVAAANKTVVEALRTY